MAAPTYPANYLPSGLVPAQAAGSTQQIALMQPVRVQAQMYQNVASVVLTYQYPAYASAQSAYYAQQQVQVPITQVQTIPAVLPSVQGSVPQAVVQPSMVQQPISAFVPVTGIAPIPVGQPPSVQQPPQAVPLPLPAPPTTMTTATTAVPTSTMTTTTQQQAAASTHVVPLMHTGHPTLPMPDPQFRRAPLTMEEEMQRIADRKELYKGELTEEEAEKLVKAKPAVRKNTVTSIPAIEAAAAPLLFVTQSNW